MSTVPQIRNRVMKGLGEDDSRRSVLGIIDVDQALCDTYNLELARLPGICIESTGGLTLTAGVDTFTLPTSRTYKGEVRIRLQTNGQFLTRRTWDEMDSLRNGSRTPQLGTPTDFALYEGSDLTVNGRTFCGSSSAWVCDLFTSSLPADPRTTSDMEAATIVGLSAAGESALVLKVMQMLARRLPREVREQRGFDTDCINNWELTASKGFYSEEVRHHNLESVGRIQRRVR